MTDCQGFWEAEDFIDADSPDMLEDDPWSDTKPDHSHPSIANSAPAATGHIVERQLPLPALSAHSETVDVNGRSAYNPNCSPIHENLTCGNEGVELTDAVFWGNEAELSDELVEDDFEEYLEEPEPTAEFNNERHVPLYDIGDIDENVGLPLKLAIDEFLVGVSDLTDKERSRIIKELIELSPRSLADWLRWLRNKRWTRASLVLYFDFRSVWKSTPHWWETKYVYWKWSQQIQRTYLNRSVMSRDAGYELVQRRLHCHAADVIDEAWFDVWDYLTLWKRGFRRFIDFALLRARLNDGEDWERFLTEDLQDGVDYTYERSPFVRYGNIKFQPISDFWAGRIPVWEDCDSYRTTSLGQPLWFATQDWYDPTDWHDNLGWPCISVNEEHPYLADARRDNFG